MTLILPTQRTPASTGNPRTLMLYSNPKCGKTTILAGLDGNLIVDLEGGAEFVEAMKVEADTFPKLRAVISALLQPDAPKYDYISLDPITQLEDIALELATEMYMKTPYGKGFDIEEMGSLLNLAKGAGYYWLRLAFKKIVFQFKGVAGKGLILSGHVREKLLEKDGKEVAYIEIDLVGKLRSIISGHSDAIGLIYREGKDCIVSFQRTGEQVITGSRPTHLENTVFVLSTKKDDGSIETFWDQIYLPENK